MYLVYQILDKHKEAECDDIFLVYGEVPILLCGNLGDYSPGITYGIHPEEYPEKS